MRIRGCVYTLTLAVCAAAGVVPAAPPPSGFDVDVVLSRKAAQRLAATHEGITVSPKYYGDPKPGEEKHANEVGQIDLGGTPIEIPGRGGLVHVPAKMSSPDRLRWITGDVKVTVNVYSSRRSSVDNILDCDFIDADLAKVIQAQPVTLRCGLISEHPKTELRP